MAEQVELQQEHSFRTPIINQDSVHPVLEEGLRQRIRQPGVQQSPKYMCDLVTHFLDPYSTNCSSLNF